MNVDGKHFNEASLGFKKKKEVDCTSVKCAGLSKLRVGNSLLRVNPLMEGFANLNKFNFKILP